MAPTALQARIAAFEALNNGDPSSLKDIAALDVDTALPSPTSPSSDTTAAQAASPIDLKDWVIEDRPPSISVRNGTSPPAHSRSSPGRPGHKYDNTPLIHLESPPRPPPQPKRAAAVPITIPSSSSKAPPLPPRRPSSPSSYANRSASLSSSLGPASPNMLMPPDAEHCYPPSLAARNGGRGHAPASSISSFHSVSLSSDAGTDPASPHSNFVQTFPMDRHPDRDDASSLTESFEDISTPSSYIVNSHVVHPPVIAKPALKPKPKPKPPPPPAPIPVPAPVTLPAPPRLPRRPSKPAAPSTPPITPPAASTSTSAYTRRVPPPPPPSQPLAYAPRQRTRSQSRTSCVRTSVQSTASTSDRSSILSHTTSVTSLSHRKSSSNLSTAPNRGRAPPIPPAARARYDALFNANVRVRVRAKVDTHLAVPSPPPGKMKRANAGWRGLSVDLIPADNPALQADSETPDTKVEREDEIEVGSGARLHGSVVRRIWTRSKLDRDRLREIWNECADPAHMPNANDGLDRDAFARGMWKIDEELRRARIIGTGRKGKGKSANVTRRVSGLTR
ncbi:hypothetical protein OF83DRAFT_894262 [Amylostereum chailletii]|nr:hypothetical protein OF83DRAFT_894262 [Amylostereum chailletii]